MTLQPHNPPGGLCADRAGIWEVTLSALSCQRLGGRRRVRQVPSAFTTGPRDVVPPRDARGQRLPRPAALDEAEGRHHSQGELLARHGCTLHMQEVTSGLRVHGPDPVLRAPLHPPAAKGGTGARPTHEHVQHLASRFQQFHAALRQYAGRDSPQQRSCLLHACLARSRWLTLAEPAAGR